MRVRRLNAAERRVQLDRCSVSTGHSDSRIGVRDELPQYQPFGYASFARRLRTEVNSESKYRFAQPSWFARIVLLIEAHIGAFDPGAIGRSSFTSGARAESRFATLSRAPGRGGSGKGGSEGKTYSMAALAQKVE